MKYPALFCLVLLLFGALQEEAELGVVMDNMSAGQELLRQKEDRLKVLENALLGGLVSVLCATVSFQIIVKGNM